MNFDEFVSKIEKLKTLELPGIKAHQKLSPINIGNIKSYHFPTNVKKAGVLILFYPNKFNQTQILLTKRAKYKGKHSQQISFPGGKVEENDINITETALRESHEETGINTKQTITIKTISPVYIPVSNFKVTPVLALCKTKPNFKINYEVEKIIEFPVERLLDKNTLNSFKIDSQKSYPSFLYQKNNIWGATAIMLSEVKELLKLL